MNIESKYLLRFAIPGSVYILFSSIALLLVSNVSYSDLFNFSESGSLLSLIGILLSAGIVGILLGYLFFQVHFSFNWLLVRKKTLEKINNLKFLKFLLNRQLIFYDSINKICDKDFRNYVLKEDADSNIHETYYRFEYYWHKELLKIPHDKREYIAERYRHLLNTAHALGALWVSLLAVILTTIIMLISDFILNLIVLGIVIALENSMGTLLYLLIMVGLFVCIHKGCNYYYKNLNVFQTSMLNELIKNRKAYLTDYDTE